MGIYGVKFGTLCWAVRCSPCVIIRTWQNSSTAYRLAAIEAHGQLHRISSLCSGAIYPNTRCILCIAYLDTLTPQGKYAVYGVFGYSCLLYVYSFRIASRHDGPFRRLANSMLRDQDDQLHADVAPCPPGFKQESEGKNVPATKSARIVLRTLGSRFSPLLGAGWMFSQTQPWCNQLPHLCTKIVNPFSH